MPHDVSQSEKMVRNRVVSLQVSEASKNFLYLPKQVIIVEATLSV